MKNFTNWLEISRLVWTALFKKKHFYIVVAVLDDFEVHQHVRHISIEAVAPVLNMTMTTAVEDGLMTIKPTKEEQVLLDAREQEYEEKRQRGQL